MKRTNIKLPLLLMLIWTVGCSSNTLYFHEQAKFGVSTETQKDINQPISGHIGFKRTVSAAVPPKQLVTDEECKKLGGNIYQNCAHTGEALSLVSNFKVQVDQVSMVDGLMQFVGLAHSAASDPGAFGVTVDTNFATGNAAIVLTSKTPVEGVSKEQQDVAEAILAEKSSPTASADEKKQLAEKQEKTLKELFKDLQDTSSLKKVLTDANKNANEKIDILKDIFEALKKKKDEALAKLLKN